MRNTATIAAILTRWSDAGTEGTTALSSANGPGSSFRRAGRPQEREIAAVVSTENFPCVELRIAALGLRLRRRHGGGPPLQFRLFHQEIDTLLLHREPDAVAVAHEAQRSAGRGVRRDMEHDGAEGGAAHACVGDADHVLDAALRELLRNRQIAGL